MKNKSIDLGGELTDLPNENYQKFFNKFKEIDTLKIDEWKPLHLIAYFCKRFLDHYKTPYQFKFNSPAPSKCFEIFQIKKLGQLLSTQPTILKDYIDWIFDVKIKEKKFRSISFLTSQDVLSYYKMNIALISQKVKLKELQ